MDNIATSTMAYVVMQYYWKLMPLAFLLGILGAFLWSPVRRLFKL